MLHVFLGFERILMRVRKKLSFLFLCFSVYVIVGPR
jgi:hypothetical protein